MASYTNQFTKKGTDIGDKAGKVTALGAMALAAAPLAATVGVTAAAGLFVGALATHYFAAKKGPVWGEMAGGAALAIGATMLTGGLAAPLAVAAAAPLAGRAAGAAVGSVTGAATDFVSSRPVSLGSLTLGIGAALSGVGPALAIGATALGTFGLVSKDKNMSLVKGTIAGLGGVVAGLATGGLAAGLAAGAIGAVATYRAQHHEYAKATESTKLGGLTGFLSTGLATGAMLAMGASILPALAVGAGAFFVGSALPSTATGAFGIAKDTLSHPFKTAAAGMVAMGLMASSPAAQASPPSKPKTTEQDTSKRPPPPSQPPRQPTTQRPSRPSSHFQDQVTQRGDRRTVEDILNEGPRKPGSRPNSGPSQPGGRA